MIQVRGPDGSIAQFPDGTSPAAIHQAMSAHYAPYLARQAADRETSAQSPFGRAVNAATHAATFGLSDMVGAAGDAAAIGARNLLANLGIGKAAPYRAGQAYQASLDSLRAAEGDFAQHHPVANSIASGAGAFAVPGATQVSKWIADAPGFLSGIARAAGVGAGAGAAYGAGNGGGAGDVAKNAVVGALLGAGSHGIVEGIGRGAQQAGGQMASRKAVPPSVARAAGAVQRALVRDNLTPQDWQAAVNSQAPDRLPFEAGGQNLRGLAEVAAQTPGSAQQMAFDALSGRTPQAMRERFVSGVQQITGTDPSTVGGNFAQRAAELRQQATPLYQKAYEDSGVVDDPLLRAMMSRPSMGRALNRAVSIAAEEGRNPADVGFEIQAQPGPPEMRPYTYQEHDFLGMPRDVTIQVPNPSTQDSLVQVNSPTMQTWDYVKRGLDDQIEQYRNPITGKLNLDEQGRAILGTLNSMRSRLTDPTTAFGPAYSAALDAGGEPLRLEEAYRTSPQLFSNSSPEALFNQRYGSWTPAQQSAANDGLLNALYESAQGGKLNLRQFQTPAYQNKLATAFGADLADALSSHAQDTLQMQANAQKVLQGSPTYGRQAAAEDLEDQGGVGLHDIADIGLNLATGNHHALAGKALAFALKNLPGTDQSILGNETSNATLGEGLFGNSDHVDSIIDALSKIQAARDSVGNPLKIPAIAAPQALGAALLSTPTSNAQ